MLPWRNGIMALRWQNRSQIQEFRKTLEFHFKKDPGLHIDIHHWIFQYCIFQNAMLHIAIKVEIDIKYLEFTVSVQINLKCLIMSLNFILIWSLFELCLNFWIFVFCVLTISFCFKISIDSSNVSRRGLIIQIQTWDVMQWNQLIILTSEDSLRK